MSDKQSPITDMKRIAAFADGELSGQDNLDLLEQSQQDASAAKRIRHQQQLLRACRRVMREPMGCPEDLRQRVAAMAEQQMAPADHSPAVLARIGRWIPAAIAALLLLAAVGVYQSAPHSQQATELFPVSLVDRFDGRHHLCSQSISNMISDPDLPNNLDQLPEKLQEKLGQPVPGLDLSAVGYTFQAVGRCSIPGDNAVHLIYKADASTDHEDAISLWIRADDGRLPIEPGRLHASYGSHRNEKLLVWRHGGMVFYLLGDDPSQLEAVAQAL
ncbi:MAG: hypothetical protein IT445_08240 [Phycisphaeraceae bacterium]|nr:hypothetical protein [Phycisphaeraceae bacterium]